MGQVWTRDWKWLGWNGVKWTEGTRLMCRMYFLVQAWSVAVEKVGYVVEGPCEWEVG